MTSGNDQSVTRRRFMQGAAVIATALVAGGSLAYGSARAAHAKGAVSGEQTYAWPVGTNSTEETVTHVFASTFAQEMGELSGGTMKAKVFANSTLGSDRELMECLKSGDIPFAVMSPSPQVSFMPRLCLFDTPCAHQDLEVFRGIVDSPEFLSAIADVYADAGYHLLGIADQGFRVMTTNVAFDGFESFKGQKVRTMENAYHLQFWSSLGANPTPMAFSELYIGLQQGTVDAQENAYGTIASAKLYEQQDYLVNTNVIPDYTMLIASKAFYDNLPPDERAILDEAAALACEAARLAADERNDGYLAMLEEAGMEVITPDEEAWNAMVEASAGVRDNIRAVVGDELMEAYLAE